MLIKKYNPAWIADFKNIKVELDKSLKGLKYRIEHVGSTAVPNLDAKDIIDIDIIFEEDADFDAIKSGLLAVGYFHNGNQGIAYREVFKRSGLVFNPILDVVTHHLYVCLVGCEALERHLLSRNFLMKNDWARIAYQDMKYGLANKAEQNKKVYAKLKETHVNEFIDEIIKQEKENSR